MATPDMLRYTKIPLNHGSGALPAVGFGTLIPDPLATKQAVKTALEVGFRHFDCAERYRNEDSDWRCDAGSVQGGDDSAGGRLHHHKAMEHQSSS